MAAHTIALGGSAGTPTSHQQQLVFTPKASNGQRTLTISNPAPKTGVLAELIERMGKDIDGLLQYVESHRNVHGDIRKMCSIIKRVHTEVAIQQKIDERTIGARSAPAHTRKITAAENTATLSPKRDRTKTSPCNAVHRTEILPDTKRRRSKSPQNLPTKDHREKWQKVQSKKKPANNRKTSGSLRPRSDVIIIERKEEGTTYADMLRAIKSNAMLSGSSAVKKALNGAATVNLKNHCITL